MCFNNLAKDDIEVYKKKKNFFKQFNIKYKYTLKNKGER